MQFLKTFFDTLFEHRFAFSNPGSQSASASLLVTKQTSAQWCFTVNLKHVNCFTILHQYPIEILENEFPKVQGSKCFATPDLPQVYCQLPLAKNSQECQKFIELEGILSPHASYMT